MKLLHFETLKPICPTCLNLFQVYPLKINTIIKKNKESVWEGIIVCTNQACQKEYPIINGIPIILHDLRAYITNNILPIIHRGDLSWQIETLIGDCLGQGSVFDLNRQYLGAYAFDHYGDLDPEKDEKDASSCGAIVRLLDNGFNILGDIVDGAVIDIGCSVGRSSFYAAEQLNRLVLGVDLTFPMLIMAQNILEHGIISYSKRKVGIVYDYKKYKVNFENIENIDFWVCDATLLPFESSFALTLSFNVLDSVNNPYYHLSTMEKVLLPGGKVILTTPYDWSNSATPIEAWIGGHSQRSEKQGSSVEMLRDLFTKGNHPKSLNNIRIISEIESIPWSVRVHERSVMNYQVHMAIMEKYNKSS